MESVEVARARWSTVCKLAGGLPEVEQGKTYGAPALRVRGSLVARLLEDRKSIVVNVGVEERDVLCATRPETFEVPPQQEGYSMMVVRLPTVDTEELGRLLVGSWRRSAPPTLVARYDAAAAR